MGSKIRKQEISLPSDPSMVDASVTMPSPTTRTTLRKSFRHAIFVVSGFHVCMRTVFVTFILLPSTEPDAQVDRVLTADHTEYTVMLCVDLEHPDEARSRNILSLTRHD
jgi:hypothetical protein